MLGKNKWPIYRPRSVHIGENCVLPVEYSRPSTQFFFIQASRPVNNICIFLDLVPATCFVVSLQGTLLHIFSLDQVQYMVPSSHFRNQIKSNGWPFGGLASPPGEWVLILLVASCYIATGLKHLVYSVQKGIPDEFTCYPALDWHPVQGRGINAPCRFMLWKLGLMSSLDCVVRELDTRVYIRHFP